MIKSKEYVLVKHFDGFPKKHDLNIVEEDLQPIKNGGK